MNTAKIEKLLEDLLKEVKAKANDCHAATPAKQGNRTPPRTDYRGGNIHQDLVDCVRRAVRYGRTGKTLSKKERNLMRDVLKRAKANRSLGIVNTNGVDVFSHARL